MTHYELIDHTADIGIKISAPDLGALFSSAAWALFDLTCNLDKVENRTHVGLRLEGPDLEALMVSWLNELIYHHEHSSLLLGEFEVVISGRFNLSAVARGEVVDLSRHEIFRNFKAATYHQLQVKRVGDLWTAQIIFDV